MDISAVNSETSTLKPTRRLKPAARKVFDGVLSSFVHLGPSDAEQLTAYAEWSAIYAEALRETQRRPTVSVPVINRSTGNVVGEKTTRNPAFATLREAQQHVTSLGRRLLIDAHSADKRQRLLTKKARALAASEHATAAKDDARASFSEEQIGDTMRELRQHGYTLRGEALRNLALTQLETRAYIAGMADDPDCAYLFA